MEDVFASPSQHGNICSFVPPHVYAALQAQRGEVLAPAANAAAADAERDDPQAESGGQTEAVQFQPELGFADDSVQAVRVSERERAEARIKSGFVVNDNGDYYNKE